VCCSAFNNFSGKKPSDQRHGPIIRFVLVCVGMCVYTRVCVRECVNVCVCVCKFVSL